MLKSSLVAWLSDTPFIKSKTISICFYFSSILAWPNRKQQGDFVIYLFGTIKLKLYNVKLYILQRLILFFENFAEFSFINRLVVVLKEVL